jgi:protein ImuB
MYACLYCHGSDDRRLPELAGEFSPMVEETAPGVVIFPIDGLKRLIGSMDQICAAIVQQGIQLGLLLRIAIASNPDTAYQIAMSAENDVNVIPAGMEQARLAALPIECLPMPEVFLRSLAHYGITTCGEFAALPPLSVIERFGEDGLRGHQIARGTASRPLKLASPPIVYESVRNFEDAIDVLDTLLFAAGSMLTSLCQRMQAAGHAATELRLELDLDNGRTTERRLSFPFPLGDAVSLLKILRLHLEAQMVGGAVVRIRIHLVYTPAQFLQHGLFSNGSPEPARLQIILARIAALVGDGNVGCPELPDTHRPDAFRIVEVNLSPGKPSRDGTEDAVARPWLVRRIFRPPLQAHVDTKLGVPVRIEADNIAGEVLDCAGPWRSSGGWWTQEPWNRSEWDVALNDGAVYRIFKSHTEPRVSRWFVEGVYD